MAKEKLADLPGLGPTSEALLIEVGIEDHATLAKHGAVESFRALRMRFGKRITVNWIYALECALLRIHWQMLSPERKQELKSAALQVIVELEENFS